MNRAWIETIAAVGVGLALVGVWWKLRRRSGLTSRRDDAMRRHINRHYS